jgi:hypothetical protein
MYLLFYCNRYVPDWWRRDAEMMSVALMSDTTKANTSGKEREGHRRWGRARLGQEALIVELVMRIRKTRLEKEDGGGNGKEKVHDEKNVKGEIKEKDRAFIETAKYISALEGRLGILLEAKVGSL